MKQTKISKLFRAGPRKPIEDCDDLEEEVLKLEQTVREKRNLFFQLQRNKYKCTIPPPKHDTELLDQPQRIMLKNSIESIKQKIELMSMLMGIEVQSYVVEEHCAIVYHLQHDSETQIKHGIMIEMSNGGNEVSKSSLPLGFNLAAVLDCFDNVMQTDCLLAIHKALVAYYDRLNQCHQLKKILVMEKMFCKSLDGSQVELIFTARNENEADPEPIEINLTLYYKVYGVRPKQFDIKEQDLPAEEVNMIRVQCAVFRKKPLHEAFKQAFINGNGAFVMVQGNNDIRPVQRKRRKAKRYRPPNPHYNNDDTFHPEDCSATDDEPDDN